MDSSSTPPYKASHTITSIQTLYSKALQDALAALVQEGVEQYVARLTAFLLFLVSSYDIAQPDVSIVHIMVLCLLGKHTAARQVASKNTNAVSDEDSVDSLVDISVKSGSMENSVAASALPCKQMEMENLDRRQSAPAGPVRPPPTPLVPSASSQSSALGMPLTTVHSIDAAGVPNHSPLGPPATAYHTTSPQMYQNSPSPPPPQLPSRPLAVPLPPPPPLNEKQLCRQPTQAYNPADYKRQNRLTVNGPPLVPKRRPVSSPATPSQVASRPSSSPSPLHRARTDSKQNDAPAQDEIYFPPPPSSIIAPKTVPRKPPKNSQTPQRQRPNLSVTNGSTMSSPTSQRLAANQQLQQQRQQVPRPIRGRVQGVSHAVVPRRRAPLTTSIGPNGEQGYSGPPPPRPPKPSTMTRLKNFTHTPAGRVAMRVGTGMVVASLTGGMMRASDFDGIDFSGGGEGVMDGGYVVEEDVGAGYGFEDQVFVEEEEGVYYEQDLLLDAGDEEYTADYGVFEDQVAMEAWGGSASSEDQAGLDAGGYETYDTAAGDTGNSEIPGQIGPCFEDNVILSSLS